jgi:hypothetical protein
LRLSERAGRRQHATEGARESDPPGRPRETEPVPSREPRHDGQVPVDRPGAATLDLVQPSRALRLQYPGRALDLGKAVLDLLVRSGVDLLGAQLVQRRSQCAHASDATDLEFGHELRHT